MTLHPAFKKSCQPGLRTALLAFLLGMAVVLPVAAAGVLDKAKDTGKLSLGYRVDAEPFAYEDMAGKPAGYSVALCRQVAEAVKVELKLPNLAVEFFPVTADNRFSALQQGQIDLLCGATTPTLERRANTDFSIPIFAAGVGALVRSDVDRRLRDALNERPNPTNPVWRGAPGLFTEKVVFAVVSGTTLERGLLEALKERRIAVTALPVPDYATGVKVVLERRAHGLIGDKPVLLDAARRDLRAAELTVIERTFTHKPLALALRRGDDAFRLLVDRTLSRLFRSSDMVPIYTAHFGAPDETALAFFRFSALPD
jgi:ABC-type amino acid transport substrate-binding protein